MAQVKKAKLTASGTGATLVMAVEAEIDWDRGDDRIDWDLQVRFMGTKALRSDRLLLERTFPTSPQDGRSRRVEVAGDDGSFDADRGRDEVYAEVRLVPRATDVRVARTNTVKGDFAA